MCDCMVANKGGRAHACAIVLHLQESMYMYECIYVYTNKNIFLFRI